MAAIWIIQRRFYALLAGVAICSGIGWRFGSEWGGDLLRNTHLSIIAHFRWWDDFPDPQFKEINDLYDKWDINIILPPDKSLGELFKTLKERPGDYLLSRISREEIIYRVLPSAIKTVTEVDVPQHTDLKKARLVIEIDFSKANSFSSLKKEVEASMERFVKASDFQFAFYNPARSIQEIKEEEGIIEVKKGTKRYMVDYKVLLAVGDMKEKESLTNQDIAKKLFPREFNFEVNESANPESATRNVGHLYKRYKELVDGGYRDITYP